MKKEDLSALQNLYKGIFTEDFEPSVTDKPTSAKTITDGLGIYENHIKSTETSAPQKQVTLSEEAEVVTHITSSTPSTTPLKSASGILGNAQWGSVSTVNDIEELYSSMYEAKKEDQDKDGDNDFDDVRIARMIASGMSKEEAMKKVKEDPKGDEVKEEVEEIDEAAKRTPKKKRGAKDPVEYMKGRSDAGKRISGDEKSGPVNYSVRASSRDEPTQPGEKPKNTPKLSKSEKEYAKYAHSSTMDGIKKGYLRFGGPKGLPEDANYLNNTDTDNNTGSISEMTQEELIYNIVASYLLENAFAEDIDSANAMMESMSTVWVGTIIEEYNEYVEDYNEFVENLQIAGYDLTEATEEDIEEAYKDEDKKKKVERDAKKKKEESGYNPEKLNKDWYSRVTPDSKMKRKDGSMETVSQRMNREKPYVKRMTGRMGREYGSRTAANVTDVLRALQGNDPYRMKRR